MGDIYFFEKNVKAKLSFKQFHFFTCILKKLMPPLVILRAPPFHISLLMYHVCTYSYEYVSAVGIFVLRSRVTILHIACRKNNLFLFSEVREDSFRIIYFEGANSVF
jgi:hypothetical protein